MLATISLFKSLTITLDAAVLNAGKLAEAEDIHPAISTIGKYAAEEAKLAPALAKLEAEMAKLDPRIEALTAEMAPEAHAIRMLEAKLKKLTESIERNMNRPVVRDSSIVASPAASIEGLKVPATPAQLVAELRTQAAEVETELAKLRAATRKRTTAIKTATTRQGNLATKISEARKALVDHDSKLEEVVRMMRKTIRKLNERRERHEAKMARGSNPATTVPGFENSDGSPIEFDTVRLEPLPQAAIVGLQDLDARAKAWAEENLGPVTTPEDLRVARSMYANRA